MVAAVAAMPVTAGGAMAQTGASTSNAAALMAGRDSSLSVRDSVVVDGVTLKGTLELPDAAACGAGPYPVALIIAGSGPTDRDGNTPLLMGRNNSLRYLAEGLAESCIAALRYDKRGVAESATPDMREEDLRFTTFAHDAAGWIRHLREDARLGDVVVIGHSEGATLGTLAVREAGAEGLVLIAGAGRPIGEVLRQQLSTNLPPELYRQADSLLAELEAGRTVPDSPPALAGLFRPSVQPYVISWLRIDPAAELAQLGMPTLVVQGTTDLQASLEDAHRLAAAHDDVRLVVIEGMNHVFKMVSGTLPEQMPSYTDPTLPLAPELVPAIVDFVREVTAD